MSIIRTARGFSVRSRVEANNGVPGVTADLPAPLGGGRAGPEFDCGKRNGSVNGLPLSSKNFNCSCVGVLPMLVRVMVVFHEPPDARWLMAAMLLLLIPTCAS